MTNRKMYNTTLDAELIRQIKILAAQLEKRQNDLLEEAIEDLLKKYDSEAKVWDQAAWLLPTRIFTMKIR